MSTKDQLLEDARRANIVNQYDVAEISCNKAIDKDKKFIPAYVERAKARTSKGNLQEALSDLYDAEELIKEIFSSPDPERYEKRLEQWMRYEYTQQHWNEERAKRLREIYIHILSFRSDILFQLNMLHEAENDISYMINNLGANNFANYYKRFLVRRKLMKYDEALSDIGICIIRDGGVNPDHYTKRAEIYVAMSNFDAALNDCNKVISLKTSYSLPLNVGIDYYSRACVKLALKEYAEAMNDMNRAIQEGCSQAQKYMNTNGLWLSGEINGSHAYQRGTSQYENGNYEAAFLEFNTAVNQDPKNGWYYYYRGLAKQKLHDLQGALYDFEIAAQQGVEKAKESHSNLKVQLLEKQRKHSDLYDTSDKLNEALISLKQAIKDKRLEQDAIMQRFQEMEKAAIKYYNPEFFQSRADYYKHIALLESENSLKIEYFNKAIADYKKEMSIYSSSAMHIESPKSSHETFKDVGKRHVRFFDDPNQRSAPNDLVPPKMEEDDMQNAVKNKNNNMRKFSVS